MALVDEAPEISREVRQSLPRAVPGSHVYVRSPRPIYFPSFGDPEEAVPVTKRHLSLRTMLYLVLEDTFATRGAIGSNQFVYWDAGDPKKRLSPDAFVKLGVPNEMFDNWKVWERGAPDLAVEIVSKSDRPEDEWAVKLARYEASGVREVVRFDPEGPRPGLSVWDRVDGDLVERAATDPDLCECASLGLWWVVVPAADGSTLRLARDRAGKELLATPAEEKVRLETELREERRARSVAEHERAIEAAARQKSKRERDALAAEVERLRAELARGR